MEVEKKKRGRKKKTEQATPDNEITRLAMLALSGRYGKGPIMAHRLRMNYGKSKAAQIMKEVDNISKMVVK